MELTPADYVRARQLASHMLGSCRTWMGWDEVHAAALYGLAAAAASWRPGGESFPSWSWRRMRSAVIDERRATSGERNRWRPTMLPLAAADRVPAAHFDVDARIDAAAILGRLDPADRDVLRWRFRDGLTLRQVGVRLGLTESGALARIDAVLVRARAAA